MLVFLVTLGCFPGATSQIAPLNWKTEYFTPVVCFLLFNTMDFSGRVLAGIVHWVSARCYFNFNILERTFGEIKEWQSGCVSLAWMLGVLLTNSVHCPSQR